MLYDLNESQVKNLIYFLDKVNFIGLKEVAAIQEILQALNSPIKEGKENNQ